MKVHHWKNWLTASELAKELRLSKRRVQQLIVKYLECRLLEQAVIVKYPDKNLVSTIVNWSTYAAPVYRCKYNKGFDTYDQKKE